MHTPTRTSVASSLLLSLLLSGCAGLNEATMRALATSVPALAVVGDRVLSGEVLLYTDRTATLELRSTSGEPVLNCMGTMRYTSSTGGAITLRCSDGTQAQLPYTALTETSGQGSHTAHQPAVSLTYGLEPDAARAWLLAPAGKRLVLDSGSLRIE